MKINAQKLNQKLYISDPIEALINIVNDNIENFNLNELSIQEYQCLVRISCTLSILREDELPIISFTCELDDNGEVNTLYIISKVFLELAKEAEYFDHYPQGRVLKELFLCLNSYVEIHEEEINNLYS